MGIPGRPRRTIRPVAANDVFQHVCLAMAGANLAAGLSFLALWTRRRSASSEYLPFALLCLGIAAYDLFCAGLYGSGSFEEGLFWQRFQIGSFLPISVFLLWFMGLTAQRALERPSFDRLLLGMIAAFGAVGVLVVTLPGPLTLSPETPFVKHVTWGGRPFVTYYESAYGPLLVVGLAVFYAAFAYAALLLVHAYRRRPSRHLLAILAGLGVYFAGLVSDALVGAGASNFVYTSEYAYLLLAGVMSAALLLRFARLHAEVEALNAALARKVQAAEAEIDVLQDLIPICSHCKKIRRDDGFWQQVDQYFAERHEAAFTHGICPTCIEQHFPDVAERRRRRASREPVPGAGRPPGPDA